MQRSGIREQTSNLLKRPRNPVILMNANLPQSRRAAEDGEIQKIIPSILCALRDSAVKTYYSEFILITEDWELLTFLG
ncbi:hypothetical protein GCM10011357_11610 [Lacimicrobium alkaliphilum]|uniref:Uncharacterized protein n=2 Tax=Lacimicrobium alkaliphilum TaxID=1526571 RepID=A0ABQ1R5J3_9ALTE|nr:hypothetical protein GCM10011357_11610 [Lacimicrobium alkaliphilum]